MWTIIAHTIIKFRMFLILGLLAITAFMAYKATDMELSYDFAKVVPMTDPDMDYFENTFKATFGEDGNLIAVGLNDSAIYEVENFNRFQYLCKGLHAIKGVREVISLPTAEILVKDPVQKKLKRTSVFGRNYPDTQEELDTLLNKIFRSKLYENRIFNPENGATLLLINADPQVVNSQNRNVLVGDIRQMTQSFSKETGITLHMAGLPVLRTELSEKLKQELTYFLWIALAVTGVVLLFFFRSFLSIVFPFVIIGMAVIWCMGSIVLLGFKVTTLTGLIPTLIVVISIPNYIYLVNKYHRELIAHGNKMKALSTIVRKVGIVALITNTTTGIGFIVLAFTDIIILRQFGIVAGLNVMATFVISIIMIPSFFTYMPEPSGRQLKHLQLKPLVRFIKWIDHVVHNRRLVVYTVTLLVLSLSFYGIYRMEVESFMADDVPKGGDIKRDMAFFEENFTGIMPLDIVVDTGTKNGLKKAVYNLGKKKNNHLELVDELETFLAAQSSIAQPVSVVSLLKNATQAFYNYEDGYYRLPGKNDKNFILPYLPKQVAGEEDPLRAFVDSTGRYLRISLQMADVGSSKLDTLIHQQIEPKISELFADTEMTATLTGSSFLFLKGHEYLLKNLQYSLLIAFVLIACIMAILFRSAKMIVISFIPNIIPLLITAGLMGYFGIPLKPSTALIFTIAFGISVDDSIHLLAKYRQELFSGNFFVSKAISISLRETGASMIYTSIILFAGFIIFSASDFGNTVALGILTSTTLFFAMITNLIVLPSLLLTFDSGKRKRDSHPLIEEYFDPDTSKVKANGRSRKKRKSISEV